MRYTVTKQVIQVIGYIWQPGIGLCAQKYELSPYDLSNIEYLSDRESVADWLAKHSGDFQSVEDFRADFTIDGRDIIHEWEKGEDSEMAYNDAMFPSED